MQGKVVEFVRSDHRILFRVRMQLSNLCDCSYLSNLTGRRSTRISWPPVQCKARQDLTRRRSTCIWGQRLQVHTKPLRSIKGSVIARKEMMRTNVKETRWEALIEDMPIGNYHQSKILPAGVKTNPLRGLQISLHKCPNLILTIFWTITKERFGIYNRIARQFPIIPLTIREWRMREEKFPHLWPLQILCGFNRNTMERTVEIQ